MADYTINIMPPENIILTIVGESGQEINLPAGVFTEVTFDYEGNTLIFEGKHTSFIASLKTISDVFWMVLALTARGFEIKPNEPLDIIVSLVSKRIGINKEGK